MGNEMGMVRIDPLLDALEREQLLKLRLVKVVTDLEHYLAEGPHGLSQSAQIIALDSLKELLALKKEVEKELGKVAPSPADLLLDGGAEWLG